MNPFNQIEKKFFSEQNIDSLFCNIRERNPSITRKIIVSGMITAFELELEIGDYDSNHLSMPRLNSLACYYIRCAFRKSVGS